jgi:hypothetical protein
MLQAYVLVCMRVLAHGCTPPHFPAGLSGLMSLTRVLLRTWADSVTARLLLEDVMRLLQRAAVQRHFDGPNDALKGIQASMAESWIHDMLLFSCAGWGFVIVP